METKMDKIGIELHTYTHTGSTLKNTKSKKEIEKIVRNGKIDTSYLKIEIFSACF